MVLLKNWPFSHLFFTQYRPGKCVLRCSRTKKGLSTLQKQKVQTVEKLTFFQKVNPSFWSKNGHFSMFFFFGNISQENVFYDILERKNAFLGNKNKKFKKSNNRHFCKEVNPWFSSKISHFFF